MKAGVRASQQTNVLLLARRLQASDGEAGRMRAQLAKMQADGSGPPPLQ
jgi:hypothetical protein